MKETDDKIVVFGYGDERFDIPKSEILAVGRNVIVKRTSQNYLCLGGYEFTFTNWRAHRKNR